ncbi:uncharacterized protein LOC100205183 isoform X2 [Hydra vulgaris]|uniref:Uncharacterized protein LOC100205183 isoform X2 n=1 Tax=Hydra vulgaris TaxID=6087 RepID=A0ABM4CB45_HYDVU
MSILFAQVVLMMAFGTQYLMFKTMYISLSLIFLLNSTRATKKGCKKVCEGELDSLKQQVKNLEEKIERLIRNSKDKSFENVKAGTVSVKLPVCTAGEYITSDGTNLYCMRLGNLGKPIDKTVSTKEASDKNKELIIKPDVPEFISKVPRFYETRKIQSLYADTWDLHSFQWQGNTYLGVSQLSGKTFTLFEWAENAFVEKSILTVPLARKWTSFEWMGELYIVIACNAMQSNNAPGYSFIYKMSSSYNKDIQLFQRLEIATAFSVTTIQQDGHIFIAFVSIYGRTSSIFTWKSGAFVEHSKIEVTGTDIEAFHIGNRAFLSVVGTTSKDNFTYLYEYIEGNFVPFKNLLMEIRPYGLTYVKAGKEHFLAVAQFDLAFSVIFKWNGKEFEEWQKVESCKARDFATTTISNKYGNYTYLAVINYDCNPVIYVYDDIRTTFVKLQKTESNWSRDMEFLRMPNNEVYLAVAANQETTVYTGSTT